MKNLGLSLLSLAAVTVAAQGPTTATVEGSRVYSHDSALVAFVVHTPTDSIGTGQGPAEATELWISRRDGSHARRLVRGRAAKSIESVIASISDLAFSPDDRQLYFLSAAWATSDAVHVVDLASGRERFVAAALSLEVLQAGEYRGCLLVGQHRYWMAGGSYNWLWLLTASGKEIGPVIDPESEGAEEWLKRWRDEPGAAPARKAPGTPTGPSARCR